MYYWFAVVEWYCCAAKDRHNNVICTTLPTFVSPLPWYAVDQLCVSVLNTSTNRFPFRVQYSLNVGIFHMNGEANFILNGTHSYTYWWWEEESENYTFSSILHSRSTSRGHIILFLASDAPIANAHYYTHTAQSTYTNTDIMYSKNDIKSRYYFSSNFLQAESGI